MDIPSSWSYIVSHKRSTSKTKSKQFLVFQHFGITTAVTDKGRLAFPIWKHCTPRIQEPPKHLQDSVIDQFHTSSPTFKHVLLSLASIMFYSAPFPFCLLIVVMESSRKTFPNQSFARLLSLCYRTSVGCNTGPQVGTFFRYRTGNSGALHFALVVYYDARIVLEIEENTISPAEGFSLSNDDRWHDFFTQFRFTLLNCGDKHITNTSRGQPIQTTTNSMDGDHVQVLGT